MTLVVMIAIIAIVISFFKSINGLTTAAVKCDIAIDIIVVMSKSATGNNSVVHHSNVSISSLKASWT